MLLYTTNIRNHEKPRHILYPLNGLHTSVVSFATASSLSLLIFIMAGLSLILIPFFCAWDIFRVP